VQPEYLVYLRAGERPVRGCHCAQYLGVELDLIKRYPIMETEVDVVSQHVHLQPMRGS